MTSVVNLGVLTDFGRDFSLISLEKTSIHNGSHCISRSRPFQVKPSRFHTKLTIPDLIHDLDFIKTRLVKFG